ncbi:major histocompatibility complex class I-related gene protein-like isoform X2 [Rhinatrema bivittatum]|uniref:major histocompatibility complex class I-related gene protein-like isoform X2 n=1 Tax=Rhinatrema bivittatum TaxID=194408 RepID=UPI0011288DDB|nr:major histocompatibility complex class I-related gene protein-like isoform X2 [Rhinatrema bivittatum]
MYPLLLLLLLSSLCARGVLSGVHTYQVMQGCNVTEHNTTVGFYRSAFDMENFLHINTTSMNWTAEMPQAEAEVEARNANWTITQQELKNLDMFCDYAKYLASFANQTLQRKEKPRVRVTERRLSNVTMSVYCRAYGFHPGLIRMTWLKDGAETQARLAPEDVLPSPDGTYQAFVYLFIVSETPAKGHQDERAPRTEPSPEPGKGTGTAQQGLSTGGIIGVVVAVVVFVSALTLGLVSWQKRRRTEAFGEMFSNT